MHNKFYKRVKQAYKSISHYKFEKPQIGIILGSGLGGFAGHIQGISIPYKSIKELPLPHVPGHAGLLKIGEKCAVMAGRCHFYEGCKMEELVLPVFLLKEMGIKKLIVTNASGGINPRFSPTDIVLITDHINLMGQNPLRAICPDNKHIKFTSMHDAYNQNLQRLVKEIEPQIKEGCYTALPGPSYETRAEVKMLHSLGADMVGMSTIPEVIAARLLQIEVLGLSCITNMAAGIKGQEPSHDDVIKVTGQIEQKFINLLKKIIKKIIE